MPVAVCLAAVHAVLALLGFDVMRYVLRVVLPLSLALTGLLLALYLASDDPRFAVRRVFRSPDQHFTWLGFATYVTVMCGASLTLVTNIADVCRYTRSRRDMRIALFGSAVASAFVTSFMGGYAAAATGESNPFVAVAGLTKTDAVLVVVLVAVVVQSLAANVTNVYTAGLSLVNSVPALGRFRASVLVAGAAIALSGFPGFVDHAQKWIVHLGNVAAPLTGVILADYLIVRRRAVDVPALYEPHGRYRFLQGVNVAAVDGDRCRGGDLLRPSARLGEGRLGGRRRGAGLRRARARAEGGGRAGQAAGGDESPVGGVSAGAGEYLLDTPTLHALRGPGRGRCGLGPVTRGGLRGDPARISPSFWPIRTGFRPSTAPTRRGAGWEAGSASGCSTAQMTGRSRCSRS